MSKEIRISDRVFERLQALAVPLVDTPEMVIERLLDYWQSSNLKEKELPVPEVSPITNHQDYRQSLRREARQRGIRIKINGEEFRAESVSDLYYQVLRFLYSRGYLAKVKQIPKATSRQRYLISMNPIHPNGNHFVVPVEFNGYYLEAHKDYKTGIKHLQNLLGDCGLTLEILG